MQDVLVKRCNRCETLHPLSGFGPNATKSDGLQRECRGCRQEMNAATYRKRMKNGGRKPSPEVEEFLAGQAFARGCVHCGMSHHVCLDFYLSVNPVRVLKTLSPKVARALESQAQVICKNCIVLISAGVIS